MEAGQHNSLVLPSVVLTIPLPAQCALSAAAGILSHLGVFVRGEHHLQAPFLFRLYIFLAIALLLSQSAALSYNMKEAAYNSALLISSYATALFSSMTSYHVFCPSASRLSCASIGKSVEALAYVEGAGCETILISRCLTNRVWN